MFVPAQGLWVVGWESTSVRPGGLQPRVVRGGDGGTHTPRTLVSRWREVIDSGCPASRPWYRPGRLRASALARASGSADADQGELSRRARGHRLRCLHRPDRRGGFSWRTSNAMSKTRPAGSLHFKESEHELTSGTEKWRPHDPRGFELGTDTFVLQNGKIVTQKFAGRISPKPCSQ
jgi:hypothetical protein